MTYKILDVHVVFENDKPFEVMVLWESNKNGWVRATYADTTPSAGYMSLTGNEVVSIDLFQEVAARGANLSDKYKKKYFPGKWNWER